MGLRVGASSRSSLRGDSITRSGKPHVSFRCSSTSLSLALSGGTACERCCDLDCRCALISAADRYHTAANDRRTAIRSRSRLNYTVAWTTNFASATYAVFVQCNDNTSGAGAFGLMETRPAASVGYLCVNPTTLAAADATMTQVVAYGSQ
jgi:hypothetical protein